MLMYVGVVEFLRNLPLYREGFVSPLIRDLESRRDVLTGQSAEPNTFTISGAEQLKFAGAEQKTSGISGDEPQLRAALAGLEEMKVLMARITASLYALQYPVHAPRCPQLPRDDTFAMPPTMAPALADLIANLARERSSAHSWPEEEKHNDIGALAAHRVGEMILKTNPSL